MEAIPPCPHLPAAEHTHSAVSLRAVGTDRGAAFYHLALVCAQALWQKGLPAQAILMLNRALSADLGGGEVILKEWPPPYRALRWILEERAPQHFLGNPRRHFQHLATRMRGPRSETRSWRAWACWAIARHVNPADPADAKQIAEEGIVEPDENEIHAALIRLGWSGEANLWQETLSERTTTPD